MSLLEQAIIDAAELKEAALKNAETAILEKYSTDIKEAVDTMLGAEEDEDPLAGLSPEEAFGSGLMASEEEETLPEEEIPYAADAELRLCPCPDDDEEVTISFDQLQAMAGQMGEEEGEQAPEEALAMAMGAPEEEEEEEAIPMMESIDLDELLEACGDVPEREPSIYVKLQEETIEIPDVEDMDLGDDLDRDWPPPDEDIDLAGALEEMVREALTVDVSEADRGEDWAGEPEAEQKYEDDMYAAKDSDSKEKNEAYEIRLAEAKKVIRIRDAQIKELRENLQTLVGSSNKLKQTFMLMREQFEKTNLSNAKLLYTNRTLKSTSLNERQKNRIVESIQDADTIEEAKVIYETLQSAVGGSSKSTPKSLNEAIKRPSMSVPRRRRENSNREIVVKNRFQALAGIKKVKNT